jgi:hypothetical protein
VLFGENPVLLRGSGVESRVDRSPLKALPLREPGQSVRSAVVDLLFGRLLPLCWLTSLAAALALLSGFEQALGWRISAKVYLGITLVLVAATWVQLRFVSRRLQALQLGRDGELAVGQFLEQQLMPYGARVVHDVPADGFNLDHVVIAPQGVFVIETKTRTKPRYRAARVTLAQGGLRIGGFKPDRDPITQVRASSRWLSRLLSAGTGQSALARGVVLFPGWFVEPMTREWLNEGHPWVLEPKSFPALLLSERSVLTERDVATLTNHLTRYVRGRESAERMK